MTDNQAPAADGGFPQGRPAHAETSSRSEGRYWGTSERDVVKVSGPQAGVFLQGQLTQDVESVAVGSHKWSWLLEPSGKVVALLRVFRVADEEWVLEVDPPWGEQVAARLARFKLRTKAELATLKATLLACRGKGWRVDGHLVASPPWPGLDGLDVLILNRPAGPGDDPAGPEDQSTSGEATPGVMPADLSAWPTVPAETLEADRIAVGQPRMGAELTERTIPAETGLVDLTVSFTKGCYTGQELVARIDSRGNHVPRRMVRLRPEARIAVGAELHALQPDAPGVRMSPTKDGTGGFGRVTSVAYSAARGWVALGYLDRKAGAPTEVAAGDVAVKVL